MDGGTLTRRNKSSASNHDDWAHQSQQVSRAQSAAGTAPPPTAPRPTPQPGSSSGQFESFEGDVEDNDSIFTDVGVLSPTGHADAQTLACMLQEQLDAINNEIRSVHLHTVKPKTQSFATIQRFIYLHFFFSG